MKAWLLLLLAHSAAANFNGLGHSKALRGMFEMVKAQVKAGTGINDEVQEVVNQLLDICDAIIGEIKEDHDFVQEELDAGHLRITTAKGVESSTRATAVTSDTNVNSPANPVGCRENSKSDLIEWEKCMKDLEICRDVEWQRHDDYEGQMIWNWAVSPFATDDNFPEEFLCVWKLTGDNNADSASKSDCPHWDDLESEKTRLVAEANSKKDDYDNAVKDWKIKYDDCEAKRVECTSLWNTYESTNIVCESDYLSSWGDKCVHGTDWQNLCTAWYTHDAYVQEVRATDGGTNGAVSEYDRQVEYDAVKTIQCMLRHYEQDRGLFNENVGECEALTLEWKYLAFDDSYSSEVGDLTYYDDMPPICSDTEATYSNFDWTTPTAVQRQDKCDGPPDACPTPYTGSRHYNLITPRAYDDLTLPTAANYLTFDEEPFNMCPEKAIGYVPLDMAPKFYDTDIVCAYMTNNAYPWYCAGYEVVGCTHVECMR